MNMELNPDQNKDLAFWNTDLTFVLWQQAEATRQCSRMQGLYFDLGSVPYSLSSSFPPTITLVFILPRRSACLYPLIQSNSYVFIYLSNLHKLHLKLNICVQNLWGNNIVIYTWQLPSIYLQNELIDERVKNIVVRNQESGLYYRIL